MVNDIDIAVTAIFDELNDAVNRRLGLERPWMPWKDGYKERILFSSSITFPVSSSCCEDDTGVTFGVLIQLGSIYSYSDAQKSNEAIYIIGDTYRCGTIDDVEETRVDLMQEPVELRKEIMQAISLIDTHCKSCHDMIINEILRQC